MRCALPIAVVLSCCCAIAQEPNPKFDRLIEAVSRAHTDRINGMQNEIKSLAKDKSPRAKTKSNNLKKSLAAARKEKPSHLPKLSLPPKAGEIGTLHNPQGKVMQVLDERNMLVNLRWETTTYKVVGNNAVPIPKTNEVLVWMTGKSTAGIADDTLTDLNVPWEAIGTKTYETRAGSSTVTLLEQFDMPAFDAYRSKK